MSSDKRTRVLVAHHDPNACEAAAAILRRIGCDPITAAATPSMLASAYADPPQCILLAHDLNESGGSAVLLDLLKSDNLYGHVPVILLLDRHDPSNIPWDRVQADDYLREPIEEHEVAARIALCLARMERDINASPLTGLPGNVSILRQAERRLQAGIPFAIAYLDLDDFKPFNDKYGFPRGDEVLRMTARVLVTSVQDLGNRDTFVGHVGGDDFVFITPPELVRAACESVIKNFGAIVPSFYDEEDRGGGGITSIDRKGEAQFFPTMSCTIAAIDTARSTAQHLAELSTRCAGVKKCAKAMPGSNYLIDRRQ